MCTRPQRPATTSSWLSCQKLPLDEPSPSQNSLHCPPSPDAPSFVHSFIHSFIQGQSHTRISSPYPHTSWCEPEYSARLACGNEPSGNDHVSEPPRPAPPFHGPVSGTSSPGRPGHTVPQSHYFTPAGRLGSSRKAMQSPPQPAPKVAGHWLRDTCDIPTPLPLEPLFLWGHSRL